MYALNVDEIDTWSPLFEISTETGETGKKRKIDLIILSLYTSESQPGCHGTREFRELVPVVSNIVTFS